MTCPERIDTITIRVYGEPNSTDTWHFSDSQSVMRFAETRSGPFVTPFQASVTYDSTGTTTKTFSMRAVSSPLATSGHTTIHVTNGSETLQLGIFINQVVDVRLAELNGSSLGANPGPQGGLRFYPESPNLGDPVARTLRVTAHLKYPAAGLVVLFDGWDVDDPSAGDRDGDADPIDNSGNSEARLSSRTATTDTAGKASVEFDAPLFAGDNYRFYASCSPDYLFSIRPDGYELKDPDGDVLPTSGAAKSEMVTMWRHLHVEIDTMTPVDGNQVVAKVASVSSYIDEVGNPRSLVGLRGTRKTVSPRAKRVVMATDYDVDSFAGGSLEIAGTRYVVTGNSGDVISVRGTVPASAKGAPVVLVDDDNAAGGALDGDEGDAVPAPDTSMFASRLAKAYLSPVLHHGGTAPYVDFGSFTGSTAMTTDMTNAYRFDRAALKSRSSWVVYQLGAYEFFREHDNDPEDDPDLRLGQTDLTPGNSLGTMVFAETIRDHAVTAGATAKCSPAGTAIHELFHLLSVLGHVTDGLMAAGCPAPSADPGAEDSATQPSADTLRQVRGLLVPGQPIAPFPNQTVPPL